MDHNSSVLHLERLAFHTWPALRQWKYDDWTVRSTGPFTKRANSVFSAGAMPLSQSWLAEIEAHYTEHGLVPQFHISPASPPELDATLEAAGYTKEMVTSLYTASCADTASKTAPAADENTDAVELAVQPNWDHEWMNAFLEAEQYGEERRSFYEALFDRISPKTAYISIRADDRIAGIGTAVSDEGWTGFINIAIHPSFRRRGFGRKLMHGMAAWLLQNGSERLYLQVLADNAPAIALYRSAGFAHLYDYHYRVKVRP